eukprot:2769163-Rhodomonas_salina.4
MRRRCCCCCRVHRVMKSMAKFNFSAIVLAVRCSVLTDKAYDEQQAEFMARKGPAAATVRRVTKEAGAGKEE